MTQPLAEKVGYGMRTLVDPPNYTIDIIAIQGLGAKPDWTWRSGGALWLRDFLPGPFPNARISTWGYNSRFRDRAAVAPLDGLAEDLLVALSHHRQMNQKVPVIFIAHSFGGIVLQEALVIAQSSLVKEDYRNLHASTVGIIFLGTPHSGTRHAQDLVYLATVANIFGNDWHDGLLKLLVPGCEELRKLRDSFLRISSNIKLVCAYENIRTLYSLCSCLGRRILTVDRNSATIQGNEVTKLSFDCNHSQLNKFASREDVNYIKLVKELETIVESSLKNEALKNDVSPEERKILDCLDPLHKLDDSPTDECMEGTRKDILADIDKWIENIDTKNIVWIKGLPGAGKSAISMSVVEHLRRNKQLGAQFFFKRDRAADQTSSSLWRTVAFNLALQYTPFRKHLVAQLEDHSELEGTTDRLFDQIILNPLGASVEMAAGRSPVIVIDALDECGGLEGQSSQHRKSVLRTLSKWSKLDRQFKIIVTSRGEDDIERHLKDISDSIEIRAGSNVDDQSSADIRTFLTLRFREIAEQYDTLPADWPGIEVIRELTAKSGGLFIWAKAVIGFICSGVPVEQLRLIKKVDIGMAALYSTILRISFPNPTEQVITALRSILGAIILAKIPFSAQSLAPLLSVEEVTIEHIFKKLKSVVESGSVSRISHESFTDFLIDQKACPPQFYINLNEEQRRLTVASLRTMKNGLKFNICNLESSYLLNDEVHDIELRVKECVPFHVSYACWFWADHLNASEQNDTSETSESNAEVSKHLRHFMKSQFLYWLEVLSLTKRMRLASGILSSLINWMKLHNQDATVVTDLKKFVTTFGSVMSQSAPHIYISALPFALQDSFVSKYYRHQYPRVVRIRAGGLRKWPPFRGVFYGHTQPVESVAFSPDGTRIVSGSGDRTVRVWDAETDEMIAGPFEGHNSSVSSVAFSPDGTRIVSGSEDKTVRVWDAETGEMVGRLFEGHNDSVWSVAFSPDGTRIVSGSKDNMIRVWDTETGEMVGRPSEGHNGPVTSVIFSPDGTRIVSGSGDKTVRVWDADTSEMIARPFEGHSDSVMSVAFSPDGTRIVSGSEDNTIRLWYAETGEMVADPFEGHSDSVWYVAFSPDGTRIASGSKDKTVRVWDAETGETVAGPFEGPDDLMWSMAFSPDGTRIVSGMKDNTIRLWDAEMGEMVVDPFKGHSASVWSAAFSPDGTRIVSGSEDNTIRVWNSETGEMVAGLFEGHNSSMLSVAFSPDGTRIVSGSKDNTIRVWNAETGEVVAGLFKGHKGSVWSVAFSPNGTRIVSGSKDKTVRVWDAGTGEMVADPFEGHSDSVMSVAFSPDGTRIVSGSKDNTIRVWNTETGEIVAGLFEGYNGSVWSVAFSPDGTRIVSGAEENAVRVWDAETGEMVVGPFEGQNNPAFSVAFSPDGTRIVSGSSDNMVRVWDAETGEMVAGPFQGHNGRVFSVAFSPDGTRIVSGSEDKTVRLWDATSFKNNKILLLSLPSRIHESWMLDSDSRRFLWIPPSLTQGMPTGNCTLIIGDFITSLLNMDVFEHGETWARCKAPDPNIHSQA